MTEFVFASYAIIIGEDEAKYKEVWERQTKRPMIELNDTSGAVKIVYNGQTSAGTVQTVAATLQSI